MNKNNMNKLSEGYHIYRESKKEFVDSWNKQNPDKVCSLSIWKTVQWISGLFVLFKCIQVSGSYYYMDMNEEAVVLFMLLLFTFASTVRSRITRKRDRAYLESLKNLEPGKE